MIERYSRPEMAAIWSDENRYRLWLKIEVLACEAMGQLGLIPENDWLQIKAKADFDVGRIGQIEKKVDHDVIAFLTDVAGQIGPASRFMHRGLTSSDVLDTALAVMMVQAADLLIAGVQGLRQVVAEQAWKYKLTPMMGRSHGVHAEPITFGLKMALMYDELGRALQRLEAAREAVRVGQISGAMGTYAHLDPVIEEHVCSSLGLRSAAISTQILQRDNHAQYMTTLALVGTTIERWAQEFRHLQRTEVKEVEEHFGKEQKGSSAMPHKKNPIVGERLCGLARLLRGYALASLENVPLWHERDISHSSVERIAFPDATILLDYMLNKMTDLVCNLRIFPENMQRNIDLTRGLIHSEQVLLALVGKGLTREEGYHLVQRNALKTADSDQNFLDVLLQDKEICRHLNGEELAGAFTMEPHLRNVERIFKRVGL